MLSVLSTCHVTPKLAIRISHVWYRLCCDFSPVCWISQCATAHPAKRAWSRHGHCVVTVVWSRGHDTVTLGSRCGRDTVTSRLRHGHDFPTAWSRHDHCTDTWSHHGHGMVTAWSRGSEGPCVWHWGSERERSAGPRLLPAPPPSSSLPAPPSPVTDD
eukprot:3221453-Rhodomonas_salina.1